MSVSVIRSKFNNKTFTVNKEIKSHFAEAFRVLNMYTSLELNFQRLEALAQLIAKVTDNSGKILTAASDESVFNAQYFSYLFGKKSAFLQKEADISEFGSPGDMLLIFSLLADSDDLTRLAQNAVNADMLAVLITGSESGTISQVADLEIRTPKTTKPARTYELHTVMIHALAEVVIS